MYDFSFNQKNIARELRRSDFYRNASLAQPATKAALIDYAARHAANGFNNLVFDTHIRNSKPVYDTALLSQDLVLRKLRRNIKILTRVRQADRNEMILSLRALLCDGSAIRIYKIDIRNFYESIDRSDLEIRLARDFGFPASSLFVFRSFSEQLKNKNIMGLPRGLAISETLTEYVMRPFDRAVRQLDHVYYFGRYVDDIVIMTTGKEDQNYFQKKLRDLLPKGLFLNQGKCKVIDIEKNPPHDSNIIPPIAGTFDFLGYQFDVSECVRLGRSATRIVKLDIAPKKIKRMKSRLVLALRKFVADGNFDHLTDRLKVLTGNYSIYDFDLGLRRRVGLGSNYRFIDVEASEALHELDQFIVKILTDKQGGLCMHLSSSLTPEQKRHILKFKFSHGFNSKSFHHINARRVANAIGCWKHV